jgi:hypothetical protein
MFWAATAGAFWTATLGSSAVVSAGRERPLPQPLHIVNWIRHRNLGGLRRRRWNFPGLNLYRSENLSTPAAEFMAWRVLALARCTNSWLIIWVARKVRTTTVYISGRSRFPHYLFQKFIYGLITGRGRIAEVHLGPASKILLQQRIGERIQF